MGNADSSRSAEQAALGGFHDQSTFRRQSPNVARLVRGENSQKMEYEFPINDNHLNSFRQKHSRSMNSSVINYRHSPNQTLMSRSNPVSHENLCIDKKLVPNETSGLWLSLTKCFACRTRQPPIIPESPLRDQVHTIRIVRASNDLTPAVFDSHYNIITLEQLRECESNGSDGIDPSNNVYVESTGPNENGSMVAVKSKANRRMKRKKRKSHHSTSPHAATSDDEDPDLERT